MRICIIIGLFITLAAAGQDTINYEYCLDEAVSNSPRLLDRQLIDEKGQLMQENLRTAWYPDLTINGKYSYQSDVVTFDFDIPGLPIEFPEMPHSQYGINLDIRQTIYDGGISKKRAAYEKQLSSASMQQVEVDMHGLKTSVSEIYFNVLLLQENRNILEILLENLSAREKVISAAIENGAMEKSDQQLIQVEILKTLQGMSEIDAQKSGLLNMLSVYLGQELDPGIILLMPVITVDSEDEFARPELSLFDLQSNVLDAGKELHAASRMPRVFAFGQTGIGMPGYNFMNTELDGYFMLGAGLQWNIWDWNKSKRERQMLDKQQQMIEHARQSFILNLDAHVKKETQQISHLKKTLSLDNKMLEMRKDITKNAAVKLDNGIISATDYLQVLNEESSTRVKSSTHQLQLIQSFAKYNIIKGTL